MLVGDDSGTILSAGHPSSQLPLNEYVLVTGVFEKGETSSVIRLFVNGTQVSEETVVLGYSDTNVPLAIGALYRGSFGPTIAQFTGDIDDVRIYNRALSFSEEMKLYSPPIPFAGFSPSTAHVHFGDKDKADHLFFSGSFLLGEQSDGIDIVGEEMVLKAGPLDIEIPSGSFQEHKSMYNWDGNIDGARIKATLIQHDEGSYSFSIQVHGVDLSGWSNPEEWELKIGNDVGKTTEWLKGHLQNDDN